MLNKLPSKLIEKSESENRRRSVDPSTNSKGGN